MNICTPYDAYMSKEDGLFVYRVMQPVLYSLERRARKPVMICFFGAGNNGKTTLIRRMKRNNGLENYKQSPAPTNELDPITYFKPQKVYITATNTDLGILQARLFAYRAGIEFRRIDFTAQPANL